MYDPHRSPCAALDDTEANLVLGLSANNNTSRGSGKSGEEVDGGVGLGEGKYEDHRTTPQ